MNPELEPPQPDEIATAIADLASADDPAPDPWWRAGIEEALGE